MRLANATERLQLAGIQLSDVLDAYARARPELGSEERESALLVDLRYRVSSIRIADGHSRHSPERTFMYVFTWESPRLGTTHALDLLPVFGNYDHALGRTMELDQDSRVLEDPYATERTALDGLLDPLTVPAQSPR